MDKARRFGCLCCVGVRFSLSEGFSCIRGLRCGLFLVVVRWKERADERLLAQKVLLILLLEVSNASAVSIDAYDE